MTGGGGSHRDRGSSSQSIAIAALLGHVLSARRRVTRGTAQDWSLRARPEPVLDYVQKPTTFLFKDITNPLG